MTGMALAHCILGKFLGVVCHCFPPLVLFYLGVFNFCTCCIQICIVRFVASLSCVVCDCCWLAVCIVVVVLYMCYVVMCICCTFFFTLDAGLLSRSQYSEGPATGHLDTGFSWFPCV